MRLILKSNERVIVQTEAGNVLIASTIVPDNQGIIVKVSFPNLVRPGTELQIISDVTYDYSKVLLNINNRD